MFSHNVFLCNISLVRHNVLLCGNGLRNIKFVVYECSEFGLGPKKLSFGKEITNDKIFDLSKLKAFADEKINVNKKLKFYLGRVENIVGKGENAGHQHFLLFPQCFQKASYSGS